MSRRIVAAVGVLLACSLVGVPVYFLFFRPATDVPADQPVQIEVPAGTSTAQIADLLASEGIVDNAAMFRLRSRIAKADGRMRPGVYDFVTGMPYGVVIDQLVSGPPIDYVSVTIPEGFTVEEIAARLEEQAGIPAEEFTKVATTGAASFSRPWLSRSGGSLEGYLFPKTYRIPEGASPHDVIEMMLRQFEKETAGIDPAYAAAHGLDLHAVVTIASMIEKEAKLDSERPLVSSVIYNRLARGMKLEIDATIAYVLPQHRFRLRNKDLKVDSPYNTYMHAGLPPGPIASPGLASLKAAAAPAETDYIYYVLTGKDGSHTFTTNLQDFLVAKDKSKQVFGK